MEAYTRWVESAVWSVLAKSGLLSERERLPTRSLIFILLPEGYRSQKGKFRLVAEPGVPTQQIWFQVCLWKETPQAWWEHDPGLMALYPLCNHGQGLPAAISHAAAAIRRRELDGYKRADLLTTLGIFGRLKDRTLDVLSIIGREQMRDSPFYQQLVEEGRVSEGRAAVLDALEVRFGTATAKEFEEPLNKIENLDQLRELRKLAMQSRSLSRFRRAFPKS
jgi:hypothetical protein